MEMIFITMAAMLLALIFITRRRVAENMKKRKQERERILIEDALKYMYDSELVNKKFSTESLSEYLSVPVTKSDSLLKKMKSLGLIKQEEDKILLTENGNTYACQIIRVHRLWENYLAEKTSMDSSLWHIKAHKAEHHITPEEADALAAKMGNPLFDPHGDPIPDTDGKVHINKGKLISELGEDETGKIIHIEDEPAEIYDEITAHQLYPGMIIRILKKDRNAFTISAGGKKIFLTGNAANNITVGEINSDEKIYDSPDTLASLKTGEEGEVIGIANSCRGQQRRRLMDFGVVPGSKIKAELKSLGGNPVAYNIRGALIALRKENAEQIFIKKYN